ncbi:DUF6081 family protein, partial [Streptomyces sp. NPDC056367]|uniref:DUF6081 family protein n=1 Tax=Streptomyces sp. NPDC056367 TaxID=3345797 RepID=UPI0035D7141C
MTTEPGASYAASSYAMSSYALPVATRTPGQGHDLAISFDKSAGKAVWRLDGHDVLSVDRVGHLTQDRRLLILDHGGTGETVSPRQLSLPAGRALSAGTTEGRRPVMDRG